MRTKLEASSTTENQSALRLLRIILLSIILRELFGFVCRVVAVARLFSHRQWVQKYILRSSHLRRCGFREVPDVGSFRVFGVFRGSNLR